ncbi:MAG: cob(I)yrinic acid a,c-diamide adenosyltransferase [Limnochordia bacterium]|nr:cob(I)yrinic acid a,c-diamide adenosyltransferase [Limnochordia bacterium]
MVEQKGYVHVYTGCGKGKSTAALGLALRAICAGKRVFFGQFVKGMKYSETRAGEFLPGLLMQQFGRACFIHREPEPEDIRLAQEGLRRCAKILRQGEYEVVVLDELNIALYYQLFSVEEVLRILKARKPWVEVIITGRYAPQELIDMADLVTEMREIKHYYEQGVVAREGIEK